MAALVLKHGVMVSEGLVATSRFLKEAVAKVGSNRKFVGTFEQLEDIVTRNLHTWEPGTGSVGGDVKLVQVPTEGFFTDIVEITSENKHKLEVIFAARREGEAPVPTVFIRGDFRAPAHRVQIVVYRADVLAQDDDRSTHAEWEIVAILSDPKLPEGLSMVPMSPQTMARNAANLAGGTLRSYSNEEWTTSVNYWASHARVVPEGELVEVN